MRFFFRKGRGGGGWIELNDDQRAQEINYELIGKRTICYMDKNIAGMQVNIRKSEKQYDTDVW